MAPEPTELTERHVAESSKEEPERGYRVNDLTPLEKDNVADYYPQKYESQYQPPAFSFKELKSCVPAHLFQRSLTKSLLFTVTNLIANGVLFYLATYIDLLPKPINFVVWPIYWWFQGVAGVGIWILAHECGHQAFSDYKNLNHAIGLVLHSFVLVPYHSWRISHSQHHSGTGNIDQDQAYVPRTRAEYWHWNFDMKGKTRQEFKPRHPSPWEEALESSPIYTLAYIMSILLFGWPLYLFFNVSGQKVPGHYVCHYLPSSPIFQAHQKYQILASDAGIIAMLSGLGYWSYSVSLISMIKYYFIPYLIVNAWLIVITMLQHTDVYIPHYSTTAWNFVRGSLATVDRDYGWFLNHAFHHIHDSHVAHHLFSQMPFYNAIQATPYLKEKLGEYYIYDRTPWWKAMWRVGKHCRFVEDSGDVLFYRNK